MSNVILSAQANSSLLQTLNQSESKLITSIYSTPTVYAPSATSWYTLTAESGSATDGMSETFALPKYGILQNIILSYNKVVSSYTQANGATIKIPAGDVFNVLSRVEFLSSSRVLCTLYAEDIIAQLKNLSTDEYSSIANFLKESATIPPTGNSAAPVKVSIPIVFPFFQQKRSCPNLAFQEPCQLRVVYKTIGDYDQSTQNAPDITNVNTTITSNIMLRYKLYDEADTAQLLASNYEDEMLNILSSRNYRENPVSYTPTANSTSHKFTMELKNVDVVEDFYFMVRGPIGGLEAPGRNQLFAINRVRLTAAGQEICDLTGDQLLFMKLSESGWPVNSSFLAGQISDPILCNNVAKVQTGLWTWSKDVWTNGFSLREMTNVVAEVYVDATFTAGKTYTCYCQELTSCIISISSNTGRTAISLAN